VSVETPISARIAPASFPIHSGLMMPGLRWVADFLEDDPLQAFEFMFFEAVGAVRCHCLNESIRNGVDDDCCLLVDTDDVVVE